MPRIADPTVTLGSSPCVQKQLQSSVFRRWAISMKESPDSLHRKLWEYCYIAQALFERGMLKPRKKGLGFAVGREPLVALFANHGCDIVATDLDESRAAQAGWVATGQHACGMKALNGRGICPPQAFERRVKFRVVDMNDLPADLRGFDFVWSSCAIEHLGSLAAGMQFMQNMMRCLKPGGVAVHTTEYNCSSNDETLETGGCVLFRRRDLFDLQQMLEADGHVVRPFDFDTGSDPADLYVDEPPYRQNPHLKLRLGPFVSTSIGIIVQAGRSSPMRRAARWISNLSLVR